MVKFKINLVSLLLFILLLSTEQLFPQTNIHSIGFDVGSIGSADPYSDLVIFPEIFVSGNFFTSNFNWKVNVGYWDDGIDGPMFADSPTYSYSSFVVSAELLSLLPITSLNRPSPVRILSGFSYHYIDSKMIRDGISGIDYSKNYTGNLFYLDVGLEIHILIKKQLTLFIKGVGRYLLNNREALKNNRWKLQFSLGINYNFRL